MTERTESAITVAASPAAVLDVIADFESYPRWAFEVKATTILSEEGDGWPDQVQFVVDAGTLRDTYVLDYDWDISHDGTGVISWTLVTADILSALTGSYTLRADGNGHTVVTYRLAVDVKIPMIGSLKRRAEKIIVDTALTELKRWVEAHQSAR